MNNPLKTVIYTLIFLLVTPLIKGQVKNRPNIIFFIADDMTRDMFNCLPEGQGKNFTPNLDRLAAEGVLLTNQHVASTVCTPSRYNVLTGRYASRAVNPEMLRNNKKNDGQRVVEWNTHIMNGEINIANILKQHDYYTGAVGKNHVIDVPGYKKVKLTDDFNDPEIRKTQLKNYKLTLEAYHNAGFDFADGIFYENPDFNGPRELAVHNLDWTTEAALRFLEEDTSNPFFLYFATTLPHGPLDAERSWNADRRITPVGILEEAPKVLPDKSTIPERLSQHGVAVNNKKANLLWMDDALGALFDKLKELNKLENTIIFFFNDHGQYAKGTVYEGATHNPSLVWMHNGFKAGNRCDALVSNVDFTPTILDFAGIDPQAYNFDGRSFYQQLNGSAENSRESLYFEIGYSRGILVGHYKYIAVRYPDWISNITLKERKSILDAYNKKLAIRGIPPNNTDPTAPFGHVQIIPGGGDAEYPSTQRYPGYSDKDQLYDLSIDPNEQHNLADDPDYQDVMIRVRKILESYIKTIPGHFGEFKSNAALNEQ